MSRLTRAFSSFLAALAVSSFAAAPKVEETVVGPVGQGGHYVVTERGAHAGFAGAKGAKFAVSVDGVEGPVFDELLRPTGEPVLFAPKTVIRKATQSGSGEYNDAPMVFSIDGEHHAYVGRQGNELVVIHDGKEVGRAPRERFAFEYGPLTITPGGRHVYWVESDGAQPQPLYRVMMTGQPGPWAATVGTRGILVFNGDETRYAYPITTRDTKKPSLVVDGKDAGYAGQNPVFTADGKSLISIGADGRQRAVLVNGKPAATGVRIGRIVAAPVGSRWGAIVIRKNANFQDITALVIDGREVAEGENAQHIWFSPDGRRYAAASHHFFNRGPDYMIVDGKRGSEMRNVSDRVPPFWSPDSSTLIYSATTGTGPVIVALSGGKETVFPGTQLGDAVAFPKKGNRYAFSKRDSQNKIEHIVDGQPVAANIVVGSLAFSADGSRMGYLRDAQSQNATLVVDGLPVPELNAHYFGMWVAGVQPPAFEFSPDGKRLVSFARNLGLWLDGKVVHPIQGGVYFPTFTPDGNHLFWAADGEAGLALYADGQPAARGDRQFFNLMPGIFDMDSNGVAAYLGADGDVVKRFRITASPDTSVATLIANGTTVASAPAPKPAPPAAVAPPPPAASTASAVPAPAASSAQSLPAPVAGSVPAATLTWNDLVRRPETRPTTCAVNRDYRFQGGATVRTGTAVNILEVNPGELVVGTADGRINFGVKPEETDILAVAGAAWAKLAPAQRDLTYPALLQRLELWPYRVKLLLPYNLDNQQTRVGDAALLLGLEGNQLLVRHERTTLAFNVEPQETDLMAQARELVIREGGAPGRVMEEISGKVSSALSGQAVKLDESARPKYVVMYMGAGWCGPCQVFSPKLVKVLKTKAPKPADVTVLYLSGDKSPSEAKAYMTKLGADWPTIYFKNRGQLPAFGSLFGDVIPQLVVTDRHGKVLIDSSKTGYDSALTQLEKLF